MKIFRSYSHSRLAPECALTIGNFDGVHRGHQAMLALLKNEAQHRGVPSCVITFEPHPRDYFAALAHKPELAPARVAALRDKLTELARCGIDQCVVLRFNAQLSGQSPNSLLTRCWCKAWAQSMCWLGMIFALEPNAQATTPCWTQQAMSAALTSPA